MHNIVVLPEKNLQKTVFKRKINSRHKLRTRKKYSLLNIYQKPKSEININELPVEILTRIFKLLPLYIRKNVRRVCKYWYSICNSPLFLRTENFILCELYNFHKKLDTIRNSKFEYLNLEFRGAKFENDKFPFWKECGDKIYSLSFIDCVLNKTAFIDIVIHCINLQNLSLIYENNKFNERLSNLGDALNDLSQRQICCKSLVTLEIRVHRTLLSNYILSSFFTFFPNIKKLDISCSSLDISEPDKEELQSKDVFTLPCVLNKVIISAAEIEELKLSLNYRNNYSMNIICEPIILIKNLTRVKEIKFDIDDTKLLPEEILKFFSQQAELESLKCKISSQTFINSFLLCLLENCPKLRHVQLSGNKTSLIYANSFKKLVESNLETFCIQFQKIIFNPHISIDEMSSLNHNLQTLCINCHMFENDSITFIEAFSNLKFLELHDISDKVLQSIWKKQINLISLKLLNCDNLSSYGLIGNSKVPATYSIRQLQQLEYLEIQSSNFRSNETDEIYLNFIFPKIRYIKIDIITDCLQFYETLLETIKRFTFLEAISITCEKPLVITWIKICKKLKFLRYLEIVDENPEAKKYSRRQYQSIFQYCSSLRVLVHKYDFKKEIYFYDIIQKRVLKKEFAVKSRVHSEKIGTFFIDWLWF